MTIVYGVIKLINPLPGFNNVLIKTFGQLEASLDLDQ